MKRQILLYIAAFGILSFVMISVYFAFPFFLENDTLAVLRNYEVTGDENAVRKRLLSYRGEADGHEDCIIFVEWGTAHPGYFINIVEGVDPSEKQYLAERLAFAVTDSGQTEKFKSAFKDKHYEVLNVIFSEIEKAIRHTTINRALRRDVLSQSGPRG